MKLYFIILSGVLIFLSCAASRNTKNIASQNVLSPRYNYLSHRMKKAKIELINIKTIKEKNVFIAYNNTNVHVLDEELHVIRDFKREEIFKIRYSNNSGKSSGFIIGGAIGFVGAFVLNANDSGSGGGGDGLSFSTSGSDVILQGIFLGTLTGWIGSLIGRHIYYNWQEIPLPPRAAGSFSYPHSVFNTRINLTDRMKLIPVLDYSMRPGSADGRDVVHWMELVRVEW